MRPPAPAARLAPLLHARDKHEMQDDVGASGGADMAREARKGRRRRPRISPQRLEPVLAHEAERVAQIHNTSPPLTSGTPLPPVCQHLPGSAPLRGGGRGRPGRARLAAWLRAGQADGGGGADGKVVGMGRALRGVLRYCLENPLGGPRHTRTPHRLHARSPEHAHARVHTHKHTHNTVLETRAIAHNKVTVPGRDKQYTTTEHAHQTPQIQQMPAITAP